jgi:pilus assembly protein FimV
MTCLNLDPAMRRIGLAVMFLCAGSAHAVGLGSIQVQSGLGQSLKLAVPLIGSDSANLLASCVKFRIESLDGVFIAEPLATIVKSAQGQSFLQITTRQPVYEPAMSVSVDLACDSRVHRDFQILLDPVTSLTDTLAALPRDNIAGSTRSQSLVPDGNRMIIPGVSRVLRESVAVVERSRRTAVAITGTSPAARTPVPLSPSSRSSSPRNILKLSSQDLPEAKYVATGQLKLSRELTELNLSGALPPTEELSAAQQRYAMLLRGEDPLRQAERENLRQKKQIDTLQRQYNASKMQQSADTAALVELQQNSLPLGWAAGLAVLLLGTLGAAGWLGWRLRNVRKEQPESAWDMSMLRTESESESESVSGAFNVRAKAEQSGAAATSLFGIGKKATLETNAVPEFLQDKKLPVSGLDMNAAPAVIETADSLAQAAVVTHDALQFYPARIENMKVEEISDVMQEAEFWLSLNDPVRAIEILEPYGKLDLPESPMPWLFLLDLYRESNNQPSYEALRERTERVFNTRIPEWSEIPGNAPAMSLEDFPHVIERICELWQSDHIAAYLESLMLDNRNGIRRGFDIEVYQEVMLLMAIVKEFDTVQPNAATNDAPGFMLE